MGKSISQNAKIKIMFNPIYKLSILFICALPLQTVALPVQAQPTEAAPLSEFQRKYISLYQQAQNPLDEFLSRYFQRELPRFDYVLQGLDTEVSLPDFLNTARLYQHEHAGELAAGQEPPDLKLGEKVVTWSETQKLLNAAYVMAPQWQFSPIQIGGPEKSKEGEKWYLSFRSQMTLQLPIYSLKQEGPKVLEQYSQSWEIVKLLPIDNIESLRERMLFELGSAPHPSDGKIFLEELRKLSPFDQVFARLEQEDPGPAMMGIAAKALEAELQPGAQVGKLTNQVLELALGQISLFGSDSGNKVNQLLEGVTTLYKMQELVAKLRNHPDFAVKGQVMAHDLKGDRVTLSLPGGETPQSLGLKLDHGYKIVEYLGPDKKASEIGFLKLRQLNEKDLLAEPIIAQRNFELGDQYLEYAKTDFQVNFRGGIGSLTLDPRLGPQDFQPEGSVEILYSLAPFLNWSETYLNLNGSVGMLSQGQGNNSNSLVAMTLEGGLSKRFHFRQWVFDLGFRMGQINGQLSQGVRDLSQSNIGGTAFLGLAYQVNPDFILGLNAGWRYYPSTSKTWKEGDKNINLSYGLESNGPVASLFLNYQI
jgi:hypothetical protein